MSQVIAVASGPPPASARLESLWPWITAATVAAVSVSTVLGNGNVLAAIAPLLLGAVAWAICVAPLRVSLATAMFLGLAADRPGDTDGFWSSPLSPLGGLLFHNLNHIVDADALKFSGVFALIAALLVVHAYRRLVGRSLDTADSLPLAAPMRGALIAAAATAVILVLFGAARGGDVQRAKMQVQAFLQLLAVAYLFGISLRGTRDYRWLGTLIVAAACVKALMALWVRATLPAMVPYHGVLMELEYATNHGDSLLFACAAAVLVGPLFHDPTRRQLKIFALVAPLVIAGVIANDRRIAWVQIALVLAAYFVANPSSRPVRSTLRACALASPLLLVYIVVGWGSPSRVFAPVGFVRGIVQAERTDGSMDRSTLFRDLENYNLVATFRSNPVLGTGFGHRFVQAAQTDDLPDFVDYLYLPHNSMLGLWAFGGAVGFTGLGVALQVGLLLAIRSRLKAPTAEHAIAAVAAIGCVLAYVVHLWADIGFTEAPSIFLVGLALAIAGQLAVATGDWPERQPSRI